MENTRANARTSIPEGIIFNRLTIASKFSGLLLLAHYSFLFTSLFTFFTFPYTYTYIYRYSYLLPLFLTLSSWMLPNGNILLWGWRHSFFNVADRRGLNRIMLLSI